jgi:hypothetical protein
MKKLAISFSGGRTSAVMTKLCVEQFRDTHEIVITFANTGCEHNNTLEFVNNCDKSFGWGVVWVEADVNPEKGKGIRHKVVDYKTASRNGEPFEKAASKLGLCGPNWNWCTRDLKQYPMESYIKKVLGWKKKDYYTAIGIRADEIDRISARRKENRLIYPLVDAGWTKQDVINECKSWSFDLELKGEHYGNCVWCWKKSLRKLMTLAKEDVSVFDFPKRLEDKYATKLNSGEIEGGMKRRHLFRKFMTVDDIIKMSKELEFIPYSDTKSEQLTFDFFKPNYDMFLDEDSSCGESCEIK